MVARRTKVNELTQKVLFCVSIAFDTAQVLEQCFLTSFHRRLCQSATAGNEASKDLLTV